jgi:poly-gamma-glutamate capsule biosynthesis protein CapA/YwtB (metallophosphatase superfamily)
MRGFAFLFLMSAIAARAQDTTRLSLIFAGDIMQHDAQIAEGYDPATGLYDYTSCFADIKPLLESADIAIGNLELNLAGSPYKGYPQFSSPDALAYALKYAGFDVLVNSNNHSVDRGRKGVERTIKMLDSVQLVHTGTFKDIETRENTYPLVIEKKGFRLSLLNYTYGTNGIPIPKPVVVNLIDTVQIKKDLNKAKAQNTDAIIVFLHWGIENQNLHNKTQIQLAEFCFKHGAKLVIGSHPHVLQPMEWNKQKDQLVIYSLGNFVSNMLKRYQYGGAAVLIDLEKINKEGITNTTIKNASYELEWVYRGANGKYHILPLQDFETDTVMVAEKQNRELRDLFAKDARALLGKHNININEHDRKNFVYRIQLMPMDTLVTDDAIIQFYGIKKNEGEVLVGEFYDREMALSAMREIKAKTVYKSSEIRLVRINE